MAKSFRQVITSPVVCEKTSSQVELQLTDESDALLAGASVSTCTLTLYERLTKGVINSRNGSDIKGANGGTIDANGLLTLVLAPADNALLSQAAQKEEHVALIEYTWAGGARAGKKEITFTVANQAVVT